MNIDDIKARGIIKMVKPIYNTFLKPFLANLIKSKDEIEFQDNETDVCVLLMERNGEIIVSVPVFDKEDRITRYIPLSDKTEAENLSDLIEKALNNKS